MRHTVDGAQSEVTSARRSVVRKRDAPKRVLQNWIVASAIQGAKNELHACLTQPGELMSARRTGARRRSVADRDGAEIPWDASEFVDLVGTGDDMAHRSPTDAVSEVLGPQCGGGRHDYAQRRSRADRRDGVESVERPVEPVADVGPAERRNCGVVIVAVSHQDVAARALGFSAS